jgi:hypothetical protein
MCAFITKLAARRIYLPTSGAANFQFTRAFVTKLSIVRIFVLAFWAFHFWSDIESWLGSDMTDTKVVPRRGIYVNPIHHFISDAGK